MLGEHNSCSPVFCLEYPSDNLADCVKLQIVLGGEG